MKEYDTVQLIIDRDRYKKEGVHKGMFGTIMSKDPIEGAWQVIFSEANSVKDIADIGVKEEDLIVRNDLSREEYLKNNFKR